MKSRRAALALPLLALALSSCAATRAVSADAPRHVILLVADGAGYTTWQAAEMYAGIRGRAFHDAPGWIEVAVSAHALADGPVAPGALHQPGGGQDPTFVYDPARAWDPTPEPGGPARFPWRFAGYRWLRRAPDSANTATALATGKKTYVGAINVDGTGEPIGETIASIAKAAGRRAGVVTTVPLSHATPAALGGAHARSRKSYCSLALEMFGSGVLDVIAGCGDPRFDADGRKRSDPRPRDYRYVGGRETWEHLLGARRLSPGDTVGAAFPEEVRTIGAREIAVLDEWTLVQETADIAALAEGPAPPRLLVVPEAGETLQQERSPRPGDADAAPGHDPPVPGLPRLADLARAALNALDDDPDGFWLSIEGGAVDWAMHDNRLGRTIEEMIDFVEAVEAVIEWVERESSWSETLVIVTSDHDHLLLGPDADTVPFEELPETEPGVLPPHRWLDDHHSNALVPLFARGRGAERLRAAPRGTDPVRGPWIDQVDVFAVMAGVLGRS